MLAEGRAVGPGVVFAPNPVSADLTEDGFAFQAVRADCLSAYFAVPGHGMLPVTAGAGKCGVFHRVFPPEKFISLVAPGYIQGDNI